MKPTLDLTDVYKKLDDPDNQDAFKLAKAFGATTRKHFRGRSTDHYLVIRCATTAIQASLRELPDDKRDDMLDEVVLQLETMLDFMRGVLKPAEGEA